MKGTATDGWNDNCAAVAGEMAILPTASRSYGPTQASAKRVLLPGSALGPGAERHSDTQNRRRPRHRKLVAEADCLFHTATRPLPAHQS